MTEMITIPRAEYDRLVEAAEDAADLAAYDAVKKALTDGSEELIPSEFANRLIDGESPVTVYRDLRGMNKSALARAAGVNRIALHDIETGKSSGSVATLKRIADALGVSVDDLV